MPEVATMPFHLLRPLWLIALLPVVAVVLLVRWRDSVTARWGGVIATLVVEATLVYVTIVAVVDSWFR